MENYNHYEDNFTQVQNTLTDYLRNGDYKDEGIFLYQRLSFQKQ